MSFLPVTASAPGKLMLFGEHAVVYGSPCIVTAVDRRIEATVAMNATETVVVEREGHSAQNLGSVQYVQTESIDCFDTKYQFVIMALKTFWEDTQSAFGVIITTRSQFTDKEGLGSSSAVTVALMKALSEATDQGYDLDTVFRLSYATVKAVQGEDASGFDVAAATYGGTFRYQKDKKNASLQRETANMSLIVAYSGIKAKTTEYVAKVKRFKKKEPDLVNNIMEDIEKLVNQAEQAFLRQDFETAGHLMNCNHDLLHSLGVSTDVLDCLIDTCKLNGAYGAKLSGAGGGDCIISLAHPKCKKNVEDGIYKIKRFKHIKVLPVQSGAEGVRIE
ncbi:MAG: mevalonate kinase [Candidatus Electrothrix sp. AR3]|nr:mevalonate kinase [Candidatus Electrothrix sp. AR3]